MGIILRISWDKTLPMSQLTNYSKLMRLYSCTEESDELAHMQYRKGLHKRYRHKVEAHPVSKIGPLSAQFYCLLGASMTHQAPSPARWLRNHVWRIPLRIPKLCDFGRMSRDETASSWDFSTIPIKPKTLNCAHSWQSLPLSHTDNLGA